MIVNALTIDVEDYFQVYAFSDAIRREDWDSFEPRVEKNTYYILDLLDSAESTTRAPEPVTRNTHSTTGNSEPQSNDEPNTMDHRRDEKRCATFFILGWIAERYPLMVKEIHERGHEVACHGYDHQIIFNQTKEEFKDDVKRAKSVLEDLTGEEVIGYRAPTYSITKETLWALEILCELGFRYDSSIFPIKHDFYGFPGAPRFPFLISFGGKKNPVFTKLDCHSNTRHSSLVTDNSLHHKSITEFPMATFQVFGKNIPIAGGGYFRLFPYRITKAFLKRINSSERKPFVFYIHPWEIDAHLPRIKSGKFLSRFRTYVNLSKTENRFKKLFSEFCFAPLSSILERLLISNYMV